MSFGSWGGGRSAGCFAGDMGEFGDMYEWSARGSYDFFGLV